MARVFYHDPLLAEIDRLARDHPYETQDRLLTRIVAACAACPEVEALDIALRKGPMQDGSGMIGVRLTMDADGLERMRRG
jgi:hypothetical protein